jgi:hypothetical protein
MISIFPLDYGLFYFFTFFTSFPQNLFIQANKNSNFALTGIGLGLINNQRIFWISNATLIWIQYNQYHHPYLHSKINYFYLLYSSIQIFIIYKTAYLFKLLKKS